MAEGRDEEVRLLAAALYDLRLLLVGRVGETDDSPETEAAAIAYALHNDALALLDGKAFDLKAAWRRLEIVDERLGSNSCERIRAHLASEG